jgi:hypothetical protein
MDDYWTLSSKATNHLNHLLSVQASRIETNLMGSDVTEFNTRGSQLFSHEGNRVYLEVAWSMHRLVCMETSVGIWGYNYKNKRRRNS